MKLKFLLFAGGLIAVLYLLPNGTVRFGTPSPQPSTQPVAKNPAELAREAEFQKYVLFVSGLKSSMKNPASFELEKAIVTKPGTLCLTYRATNSFNALVPGQAVIVNDKIATSDHGGNFEALWNRHCFRKPGEDWIHIRQALRVL